MFIKTVSTTSGINPIKFDETGGVFYWILNTGSSTVYASTKSTFTAGDDGVVSLGPKESRRLETNTDTIYILGEGQVEIHNQRDGICSFKQAPTSSGGGETIDAYTKTESDAKYAQKTDIPTSLPANGGNADTVDGYHVDDRHHADGSIPPNYFTEFLRISDDNKSVERWSTDNLKVALANNAAKAENADKLDGYHASDFAKSTNPIINGDMIFERDSNQQTVSAIYSVNDILVLRNANKDNLTSRCDVMISLDGVRITTDTQSFKIGDGGNADTVDGLHANDFTQMIDFGGSETDTKTAIGKPGKTIIYRCSQWTDYPAEFIDSQGTLIAVNYNGSGTVGTDWIWCTQIIVNPRSGNKMFIRYTDTTSVSDWKEISTTPIKSTTVSGTTDANGNLILWAASENKIPICAILSGYCSSIFHYAPDGNYYLGVSDINRQAYSPNVPISGTVYYI